MTELRIDQTGQAAPGLDEADGGGGERIDIERIMAQVRRNVEEKRRANIYADDFMPLRMGVPRREDAAFDERFQALRAAAALPIEGEPIASHRPVAGLLIKAAKKFFRFWTRKYTDDLFLRQSYFNSELLAAVASMQKELDGLQGLKSELARLRAELSRLREDEPREDELRDAWRQASEPPASFGEEP